MKHILIFLTFATFLILSGGVSESFAQTSLQKAVNKYIQTEARKANASFSPESKIVILGDLDGDGDKDAAVFYVIEGFGGGNSWGQNLAVFLNQKGVYKFAAEETVGGKFFYYTSTLQSVKNGKVFLQTETCPDPPQGMCENPKKGSVVFAFKNGKLIKT